MSHNMTEYRLLRTVLGERKGEIPLRHLPKAGIIKGYKNL